MKSNAAFGLLALIMAGAVLGEAGAQTVPPSGSAWAQEKCRRYREGYQDLVTRRGKPGPGAAFLRDHEAFLASGCTARASVCPRSAAEIDLANALTVMAMNFGAASTFLPFACR